jgi:hypothetical protein
MVSARGPILAGSNPQIINYNSKNKMLVPISSQKLSLSCTTKATESLSINEGNT